MKKQQAFFWSLLAVLTTGLFSCQTESVSPTLPAASPASSKNARIAAAAVNYSLNNWMGSVSSTLSLAQLTIPGTHDSGARFEPISGTAKCQNLTIAEQLTAGVRFLDIRCRHIDNAFTIHHGAIYQNSNFTDVLNACNAFLAANPTETILMCVKEEYNSSNTTRSFEQTFDSYVQSNPSRWYLSSSIPTLGSVRGKIVLVRRFSAASTPKGIEATNWADNTTFTAGNLSVQDSYKVGNNDNKWTAITNQFSAALGGSSSILYLNFTSGYKSFLGIPNITGVSNTINPRLTTYFTSAASGRYGTVVMDFAEASRNSLIIQKNF